MGRSRYKILDERFPYFITSSVIGKCSFLQDPVLCSIIMKGLNFMIKERSIQIFAYLIMPNHLHFIAQGHELSKHISSFKSFTARSVIDHFKNEGRINILSYLKNLKIPHKTDREFQFWMEGFHPKQISSDEIMIQKINYIHYNPVKANFVQSESDWAYSSAGFYENGQSTIHLTRFGDWSAPTQSIGAR